MSDNGPTSKRGDEEEDQSGEEPAAQPARHAVARDSFMIGIGASAGGLGAISEVVRNLPPDARFTVFVAQHLAASHSSLLVELLARVSPLPVKWAEQGEVIETGRVYVGPAKTAVAISGGRIQLKPVGERAGGEIDVLFGALADEAGDRAIGVILSGASSDGTMGMKRIRQAGGIGVAQDPTTADFPLMPRSAIQAQCVQRVLAPAAIAGELVKLTQDTEGLWRRLSGDVATTTDAPAETGEKPEHLVALYRLLLARTGVDFTHYKQTTIRRRLARRMSLVKAVSLPDYLRMLQRNRAEVDELYEDLLINVTEFFRDPECFDFLQTQILPTLLNSITGGAPLRIWVPGCATGEEVYSLGMLVRELLDERGQVLPVQIFGTDVSEAAIREARVGRFSVPDLDKVSPERLQRFFVKTEHGYAVRNVLREMCIFARQNVIRDSPFSRVHLISCRNLMIYLEAALQRKLVPVFHYALVRTGFLMLGTSESIGAHADLFRLVDRRFRIYASKSTMRRASLDFVPSQRPATPPTHASTPAAMPHAKEPSDVISEADRLVLIRHGPVGVLVNDALEILQFRGDVSPFLAPVSGRASLNVLRMARGGLASEIETALQHLRDGHSQVSRRWVDYGPDGTAAQVDVDVTLLEMPQNGERFFLIQFLPCPAPAAGPARDPEPGAAKSATPSAPSTEVEQLRKELAATRQSLRSNVERQEVTNQELRAANEEIQSSNEELQSTNEELETAKEELQSTNEELSTVNEELHSRQLELIELNNDLQNLITSVHLPIVILDQDLKIRRFTPMAQRILNVIPSDIGRPITDINIKLNVPHLPELMQEVFDTLSMREMDVQDRSGAWYSIRLRPYKTAENKIDGIVITLIDIDHLKRAVADAEEARNFAQAVIETAREPLAVLTPDFRIRSANEAFYQLFRSNRERAEGRALFDLLPDSEAVRKVKAEVFGILPSSTSLTDYPMSIDLDDIGHIQFSINIRQIAAGPQTFPLILLSATSIRPL